MKTLLFFLIYTAAVLFLIRFIAVCSRNDRDDEGGDPHG